MRVYIHQQRRWVTDTPDGVMGVTFKPETPDFVIESISVPYNDRYGEDEEYTINIVITIDSVSHTLSVCEEKFYSSTIRIERSSLTEVIVGGSSIREFNVPENHPLFNNFKLYPL